MNIDEGTSRTEDSAFACSQYNLDASYSSWSRSFERSLSKSNHGKPTPVKPMMCNSSEIVTVTTKSSRRRIKKKKQQLFKQLSGGSVATFGYMVVHYMMDPNGYGSEIGSRLIVMEAPLGIAGLTQFVGIFLFMMKLSKLCALVSLDDELSKELTKGLEIDEFLINDIEKADLQQDASEKNIFRSEPRESIQSLKAIMSQNLFGGPRLSLCDSTEVEDEIEELDRQIEGLLSTQVFEPSAGVKMSFQNVCSLLADPDSNLNKLIRNIEEMFADEEDEIDDDEEDEDDSDDDELDFAEFSDDEGPSHIEDLLRKLDMMV